MIKVQSDSSGFDEIILRVNHFMDQMMHKNFYRFRTCGQWEPQINFYETTEAFYICADLAGVDPKQVELHLENNMLHIMGHRTTPSPPDNSNARIHVMEIDHGPFGRSIKIPENVDKTGTEATYSQGYLWIKLPKQDT
jgi:HSP20 family protein